MKKKPEARLRRRHTSNQNDTSPEVEELEEFEYEERGGDSEFEYDEEYSSGAVGVDNSFGSYYDLFKRPSSDNVIDDDVDYSYRLFSDDDDYSMLPRPDVFNSYPPEVQRKILEWTDRDVKARRDDESRRQDTILREKIARDKLHTLIPVVVIILGLLCAAVVGVYTKSIFLVVSLLVIPLVVVIAVIARAATRGPL